MTAWGLLQGSAKFRTFGSRFPSPATNLLCDLSVVTVPSVLHLLMKRVGQKQHFSKPIHNPWVRIPQGACYKCGFWGPHHKIKAREGGPGICTLARPPVDPEAPGSFSDSGPDSLYKAPFITDIQGVFPLG